MISPTRNSHAQLGEREQPLGYALREDIRWTQSQEAHGTVWIASDPLHNNHFQCSQYDYQLLQWLTPKSTFASLLRQFEERFRPRSLSPAQLNAFLSECLRAGIVRRRSQSLDSIDGTENHSASANRTDTRHSFPVRAARRMVKLMQSQISLGNPDRLLTDLLPITGFLFSAPIFAIVLLLWGVSSAMLLLRADAFWSELPSWNSLRSPALLLGYGGLFFGTRLVHELGHAIACKRFGVSCKDVGVLWSFGMLCPYVDITDGWRAGRGSHRLVIALAGMYWEGILAGVAAMVWTFTVDGWLHDLAFRTILVCSVTTFLFNANPFMKYDGYFALSDALGISNLRERAWQAMDSLWGSTVGNASSLSLAAKWGLSLYFLLSLCNRLFLAAGLAVFLYSVACYWQVAGMGIALFLLYACCMLVLAAGTWTQSYAVRNSVQSISGQQVPGMRPRAVLLGWIAVLCLIAWALQIPLPNKVWVRGELKSGTVWPVYASQSGLIAEVNSLLNGASIRKGDRILGLENPNLQKRYTQLVAEQIQCQHRLEAARRASFYDTQYLDAVPLLEKQLLWLDAQVNEMKGQIDQLAIHAPADGVFEFTSNRTSARQEAASSFRLAAYVHSEWKSLQPQWSIGEHCERSTLIGHVRSEGGHQIDCLLTEEEFADVSIGTAVVFRLIQNPTRVYRGRVQSIAKELEIQPNGNGSKAENQSATVSRTPFRYRITVEAGELINPIAQPSQAPRTTSANGDSLLLPFGEAELMLIRPDKSALQWVVESSLRHFRLR